MTVWIFHPRRALGGLLASALLMTGASTLLAVAPASAQSLFEEQGTLEPSQDEYPFSGRAGQTVTISMSSDEFDTLLVLANANGQEIASNDDYARSLNSTIVITLPTTGTYTVLARSFSGMGGNYTVTIKEATPFDQAYSRGTDQFRNGQIEEAIASFTEAIRLEPTQPIPYLDRGDLYYSQGNISGVIADYQRAADLYEQAGDTSMAQMLRDQLQYLQDPAEPVEPAPGL